MPTTNRRANKWLKEKKAKKVRNKLGIFQVQLIKEPSGRNKQAENRYYLVDKMAEQ